MLLPRGRSCEAGLNGVDSAISNIGLRRKGEQSRLLVEGLRGLNER
jgi:hypothetical protein